ncbi:hypothetical protein FGB62_12g125 [Gracilaria domingensis]|nr:hypothetical protein FGB62_12g125 [Gracilaria domingensis]
MPSQRWSLRERVPVTPVVEARASETVVHRAFAKLGNHAFEPWIGLQLILPFLEWIPAEPRLRGEWAPDNDINAQCAFIDIQNYGPFAALRVAGMLSRMMMGDMNQVAYVTVYGLESDVKVCEQAEPGILQGRLWDDEWRAQSSALCAYLLTYIYAQSPQLSISEELSRAAERETAVTGGRAYLNRYEARTNSGWYRCTAAMCSIGSRGNDCPDEPATCSALNAHVKLLEPLHDNVWDSPTLPGRHALRQCTNPEGEAFEGLCVWACLNNLPDNYLSSLKDLDGVLEHLFVIGVLGTSTTTLTSIIMLEGYYDWLVSVILPEIPHGLYLGQQEQSALRHFARRLRDPNMRAEEECAFKNWFKVFPMERVHEQVNETVLVNTLTWGSSLSHIVLHDTRVRSPDGAVHEPFTGVSKDEQWRSTVDLHWEAIKKASKKWNIAWENLDGLSVTLGHIPDRLPPRSRLMKASMEWVRNGQMTSAIINMKAHPFMDLCWIRAGNDVPTYGWKPDSELCRFHTEELHISSKVGEENEVELTWDGDLTRGKEKKVIRVEAILGIMPELTNCFSQYAENDGSWSIGDSRIPDDCTLSSLTEIIIELCGTDRIQAMTFILALVVRGVLTGSGKHACWSHVCSKELVEGAKRVECDIPIELAGVLCKARKHNRTYFAVPLSPNDATVFDVGDLTSVEEGFTQTPELHAVGGWTHCETGLVQDWLAGTEQDLVICKLGMDQMSMGDIIAEPRVPRAEIFPSGSSLEAVAMKEQ